LVARLDAILILPVSSLAANHFRLGLGCDYD
jgi:hypothetical protein